MPRYRVVDPFAARRVRRPRQTAAPDPEPLEPGELARRVAAAMAARVDVDTETLEAALADLADLSVEELAAIAEITAATEALDGQEAAESPGSEQGEESPGEPLEGATEPHGTPESVPEDWLNAAQAAAALGVDPAEVRRRCREGLITARKDDAGAWRIDPAAVTSP